MKAVSHTFPTRMAVALNRCPKLGGTFNRD